MVWYFWIVLVLFILYILDLISILILENRDPHKTIAWILVLIFLPGIGLIAYMWAGQNLKVKFYDWKIRRPKYARIMRKIVDSQKDFLHGVQLPKDILENRYTMYLALASTNFPFSKNNSVKILNNGSEFFPELFACIETAKEHIHLEYYIFECDNTTEKLINLLIKKSKEGIKVRILCDGFGSLSFASKYKKILTENKIDFSVFLPIKLTFLRSKINHRNHRKIAIIDGKIGFIGGMNIGDQYFNGSEYGSWRDLQLKIEGSSVYSLQTIFIRDWFYSSKEDIYDYKLYPKIISNHNVSLHIAPSGPDFKWQNSKLILFSMITTSEERLYIETPYFTPDDGLLMALKATALKGVDVRIILPKHPDVWLFNYVNITYLPELLDAGVKAYFYSKGRKGVLHTKLLISDNISAIGSTNFNTRSMDLDFEANTYIFDSKVTDDLAKIFHNDLEDCHEITKKDIHLQTKWARFKQSLARLLSPII